MGATYVNKELLKKIFSQISGTLKEDDELVPEYAIRGQGYDWFYDPSQKSVVRVARGIKCYIISDEKDDLERILVYTASNDVILVAEDELIYTGFD
tara:strand:- start:5685 stop:5972 length:288 start_codon:yes stop_codon:yes gene_type:complete